MSEDEIPVDGDKESSFFTQYSVTVLGIFAVLVYLRIYILARQ